MSSIEQQQLRREVAASREASPAPGRAAASPSRPPTTGISWRALLIGALLIPVVCIWNEYDEIVAEGTDLVAMSLIISVVILLFFLVLINLALRKWAPRIAFSQAELMYIYIMMTVSVGISGIGMTQFLVPQLGNLYHFANATNKWEDFWPYVPRWFVPRRSVLPDFYAGQSTFYTWAHFTGWLVPILVWSGFIIVLLFCTLCMNVIIRRQWMDRERLTFPIVYVPLELTKGGGAVDLFHNRSMWIGFTIPCVLETLACLNYLFPAVPSIPLKPNNDLNVGQYLTDAPWTAVGYLTLAFYPLVIGIAYFLSLEVSFSCWFFYLFTKFENVMTTALGFRDAQASAASKRIPYLPEQGAGAFIGLTLFAAFASRRYLGEIFRKAFSGAPEVHDDNEPMPYRLAVFGLLAGVAALCGFGCSGTSVVPGPDLLCAILHHRADLHSHPGRGRGSMGVRSRQSGPPDDAGYGRLVRLEPPEPDGVQLSNLDGPGLSLLRDAAPARGVQDRGERADEQPPSGGRHHARDRDRRLRLVLGAAHHLLPVWRGNGQGERVANQYGKPGV